MAKLKVKSQSPPTRCDICHQSDVFDSQAGFCDRCSSIYQTNQQIPIQPANSRWQVWGNLLSQSWFQLTVGILTVCLGLLVILVINASCFFFLPSPASWFASGWFDVIFPLSMLVRYTESLRRQMMVPESSRSIIVGLILGAMMMLPFSWDLLAILLGSLMGCLVVLTVQAVSLTKLARKAPKTG